MQRDMSDGMPELSVRVVRSSRPVRAARSGRRRAGRTAHTRLSFSFFLFV